MDNLVLLCRRHHWFVHEGGFQLVRRDDGQVLTIPIPDHHLRARPPSVHTAAA